VKKTVNSFPRARVKNSAVHLGMNKPVGGGGKFIPLRKRPYVSFPVRGVRWHSRPSRDFGREKTGRPKMNSDAMR